MNRISTAILGIALLACLSGCPKAEEAPQQKAVPNPSAGGISGFVGSANKVKLKAGLMAVLNAANTYKATNGKEPEDVQALVAESLITADQAKDLWGNDYVIVVEGPSMSVMSYGADNAEGGDGPNTDWSSDELK